MNVRISNEAFRGKFLNINQDIGHFAIAYYWPEPCLLRFASIHDIFCYLVPVCLL